MTDHVFGGLHCTEVADLAASFVLGALEPAEAAAVRAHLAACPEPHPEMAELGSVVPALFESVEPIDPPARLKARILGAAAADTQRERMPGAAAPGAAVPRRATDPVRERTPGADTERGGWASLFRRPVWAGVAMAAVIAAVALGVGYLGLQQQVRGLTAYQHAVAAVVAEASKPGAQLAVLKGDDIATGPGGVAAVGPDGHVTMVMHDLKPTTGPEVYVAWLIVGQGAPVPIGGFTVDASGSASFATADAPTGEGVIVGLTLETSRAVTTPTLPMIASGSALRAS